MRPNVGRKIGLTQSSKREGFPFFYLVLSTSCCQYWENSNYFNLESGQKQCIVIRNFTDNRSALSLTKATQYLYLEIGNFFIPLVSKKTILVRVRVGEFGSNQFQKSCKSLKTVVEN